MAFKVQVGPPQIAIHQGQTVLVSEPDGHINWPSEKGLYFLDTRIISNWTIYANGEPWELLNGGPVNYHAARIFLTNKSILTEDGPIPPRTIGLTISRSIIGGMHEDLDVTNNGLKPVRFQLEVARAPGKAWHACLLYTLEDRQQQLDAPRDCVGKTHESRLFPTMAEWLKTVVKIRTSNEEFYRLFHQALEDMAALRLPIKGTDHMVFLPAAGLPWFGAPFGRDSLIVSLQNVLIYPEFARGALEILGSLQAKDDDPYRDAEPGKILHELRYGELAHFKLVPHTPYYGTADATPLYLITLHAAWRATGDKRLLERHLPTAEGCLAWIDKYGDRDGDGFQEYQTRSPVGYENMGWKDSGDSVVYPDGSLVKGPVALCELQGYVYDAWVRTAEVFDALGKSDRAQELRAKAAALFAHFNEAFRDEELGFYANALDGEKKKVLTVASN